VAKADWPTDQLIAAAQRGDVDAITALVSGSYPHVRRFAHSLCASPHDAEDAAQEALIILYRKVGTLRASAALASWMFRIVRNECLRRSRMLIRQHTLDHVINDTADVSVEDEVLRRLEAERIATAIASLPGDQRAVLIMRDVHGYSGRAAAAALGLSGPAMKSRLHRARAGLHHILHDNTDPPWGECR
jgi:RNA polymerase sigma factor (sigma-70 family)